MGCGGSGLGNLFGMVYVTRADKNALYAHCTLCAMVCVTYVGSIAQYYISLLSGMRNIA